MVKKTSLTFCLVFGLLFGASLPLNSLAESEKIFLDAIVASVDGKPITLHEVNTRLKRNVSLRELAADSEARVLVDDMINERLIMEEAAQKKFDVGPDDIERYIEEIAQRNQLSKEDFIAALKSQGKSLEDYKQQITIDILKTRIASTYLRGSVGVSDTEVENYLKGKASYNSNNKGAKLSLRQIVLRSESHSDEEIKQIFDKIAERLDDGDDFSDLAKEYSEGTEASDGGFIGVIAEKDLSPEVFDAVFAVDEESVSKVVKINDNYFQFYIEKRQNKDTEDEDTAEVEFTDQEKNFARQELERQKMEAKYTQFFTEELFKTHAVDKKI